MTEVASLVLKAEPMTRVLIVVPRDHVPAAVEALYEMRILHVHDHKEGRDGLDLSKPLEGASETSEMLIRLRAMIATLGISDHTVDRPLPLKMVIKDLETKFDHLEEQVENLGETIARDVYVQFLIDGVPLGQALYVAELAPGASELIIGSWNANMTGFHEISVVVDSTRDVDEIREDNNGASVQVKVEPLVLKTSPGFAPLLLLAALASIAVVAGVWRKRSQRRP